MSNYLSYDIEIAEELPEGERPDLATINPSVAAICTRDDDVQYFEGAPYMSKETAQSLVKKMMEYYEKGFVPFGWNTLAFDFPLIAFYSGMIEECAKLALNHVDGMFLVVCHKGHFLGLDKALTGAGLETKLHTVTLNDNTVFAEMNGSHAPELWQKGEYSAVKDYLRMDVLQPLKLAKTIETTGIIRWTSNTGKLNLLKTKMLTVKDALKIPEPDCSWMSNPKPRAEFYSWVPREVLEKEFAV